MMYREISFRYRGKAGRTIRSCWNWGVRVFSVFSGRISSSLQSFSKNSAKSFLLELLEKHCPSDVSAQAPGVAHPHGAHQFDQLVMPGADQIRHPSHAVLKTDLRNPGGTGRTFFAP